MDTQSTAAALAMWLNDGLPKRRSSLLIKGLVAELVPEELQEPTTTREVMRCRAAMLTLLQDLDPLPGDSRHTLPKLTLTLVPVRPLFIQPHKRREASVIVQGDTLDVLLYATIRLLEAGKLRIWRCRAPRKGDWSEKCGRWIAHAVRAGRPKLYCSEKCRKRAEYAERNQRDIETGLGGRSR